MLISLPSLLVIGMLPGFDKRRLSYLLRKLFFFSSMILLILPKLVFAGPDCGGMRLDRAQLRFHPRVVATDVKRGGLVFQGPPRVIRWLQDSADFRPASGFFHPAS